MEQNACVYMGEDMYVHVCVFVQEYAIQWCTSNNACVCKSSQGRVSQDEDLCPCLSTILVFLANL